MITIMMEVAAVGLEQVAPDGQSKERVWSRGSAWETNAVPLDLYLYRITSLLLRKPMVYRWSSYRTPVPH